jgi:hypothetical protein
MGIVRHSRCAAIDRLTIGPIAPHADAIKQHFIDGTYASTTTASYLIDIAHFGDGPLASAWTFSGSTRRLPPLSSISICRIAGVRARSATTAVTTELRWATCYLCCARREPLHRRRAA